MPMLFFIRLASFFANHSLYQCIVVCICSFLCHYCGDCLCL